MSKSVILLLVVVVSSCTLSPTGRPQLMLVSAEQATLASQQAYFDTLQPYAEQNRVDSSPQITSRVRRIAAKIIAQAIAAYPKTAVWNWSVRVIDDPHSINAWCMTGGHLAVYSGLFITIRPTDDELAHVLGHEIAHAVANHTEEKMSIALASHIGLSTVAVVTGAIEKENAALARATLAAAIAIQLPNSREAEAEADRIGLELAARAGYHPGAVIRLWEKLSKVEKENLPELFSTHPDPLNRLSVLQTLVPNMMPSYEEIRERPVYTFTDDADQLHLDSYQPTHSP